MARVASAAVMIEKNVLPFVFFYMAWRQLQATLLIVGQGSHNPDALSLHFASSLQHLLLFLLSVFVALMLLLNTRPSRLPANLREIIVPLIGTFFFLTYGALSIFPEPWRRPLAPADWQVGLALAALGLAIFGYAVAIWGVMCLGRSFALVVSVREIVLRGPYRYLRHPIYFGYSCAFLGLALANFSWAILLLVTIHFLLFVYRGRMEERRLAEHSQEYREYMKVTGFIFPRFRRSPITV